MLFDSLEARRLFAATSAVLKDGVLTVRGDDNSNSINVAYVTTQTIKHNGSSTSVSGKPQYIVTIDGGAEQVFDARSVNRIEVFGLGGRDRITGPSSFASIDTLPTGSGSSTLVDSAFNVAPMLAEGGSGSDIIRGGTGDDTLIGGRGNDALIDQYGTNTLEGGPGSDTYNTAEGKAHTVKTADGKSTIAYTPVVSGTPDTIIDTLGDVGTVTRVRINSDDILQGFGNINLSNSKQRVLELTETTGANGTVTFKSSAVDGDA